MLRTVNKTEKEQIVTVYGNEQAASITQIQQLPYPYGSIIVMETASARKDSQGKLVVDKNGGYRRDVVLGLHVMRREKGFGEAYGKNRTGEWEYVEYRPDETYITPPQKSFACAECHVKAGREPRFCVRGQAAIRHVQVTHRSRPRSDSPSRMQGVVCAIRGFLTPGDPLAHFVRLLLRAARGTLLANRGMPVRCFHENCRIDPGSDGHQLASRSSATKGRNALPLFESCRRRIDLPRRVGRGRPSSPSPSPGLYSVS